MPNLTVEWLKRQLVAKASLTMVCSKQGCKAATSFSGRGGCQLWPAFKGWFAGAGGLYARFDGVAIGLTGGLQMVLTMQELWRRFEDRAESQS